MADSCVSLSVKNISKSFKDVNALQNVSVELKPGIYGLIGPNGAGKSTLIRVITTLEQQNDGVIEYEARDIRTIKDYRSKLGLMPQHQSGYEQYTGLAFLYYMANLKGLTKDEAKKQITHLVKQVNLENSIQRKIKTYSGGMRQRLMFAQALLGDPKIVILDEPTAGLDPFERIKLRNYVREIAEGKVVILATHVMQDIESIADQVILLNSGTIVFSGTGAELLDSIKGFIVEKRIGADEIQFYQTKFRVSRVYKYDSDFLIRYIDENETTEIMPTFEDAYLYYMVSL